MNAINKPRLRKVGENYWSCTSARMVGWGDTPYAAWAAWQVNCHTVTKVTQTAIGDGANNADNSLIATRNEESNR